MRIVRSPGLRRGSLPFVAVRLDKTGEGAIIVANRSSRPIRELAEIVYPWHAIRIIGSEKTFTG